MLQKRKLQLLRLKKQALKQHKLARPTNQDELEVDQRFERVTYDPRFARVPKQIQKVKIDSRFSRMMTDDRFKLVTSVDKYGRKIVPSKENQELKELYYRDEEEMEPEAEEQQLEQSLEEENEGENIKPKGHDRDIREWMENYDEESDSDSYSNPPEEQPAEDMWEEDRNVVKGEQVPATRRLALCNYQWMNISAKDLMILFNSFKPAKGFIQSITVYPSELGLQRLKQEQLQGPADIWNETLPQQQGKSTGKRSLQNLLKNQPSEADDECIDPQKLRAYEKERLRYYYAVIECDSKETADDIYRTCDSHELENTGQLDLRFVPDELEFPHEPTDYCDELPSKSQVKQNINRAVGHSKVNLTWEDPELNMIAGLKKKNWAKMTEKEMEQVDWSLYMNDDAPSANENENQDEGAEQVSNEDDGMPSWKKEYHNKARRKESSSSEELEITFNSGFDLASRIKQKKEEGQLSSFDLYQKKKKEKRAQRNLEKQQKRKQQKQSEEAAEQQQRDIEKQRKQLDLLVDSEHTHKDFTADVNDPRFSAVYDNPLYTIEPTSHHFKVTKNTKLLGEVVRRKRNTAQ